MVVLNPFSEMTDANTDASVAQDDDLRVWIKHDIACLAQAAHQCEPPTGYSRSQWHRGRRGLLIELTNMICITDAAGERAQLDFVMLTLNAMSIAGVEQAIRTFAGEPRTPGSAGAPSMAPAAE